MGRRSINTTKSGKYMNPTDQARKYQQRPISVPLHPYVCTHTERESSSHRQGSTQKGAEEKQEAAADGACCCPQEQRSLTDTGGNGKDRRNG